MVGTVQVNPTRTGESEYILVAEEYDLDDDGLTLAATVAKSVRDHGATPCSWYDVIELAYHATTDDWTRDDLDTLFPTDIRNIVWFVLQRRGIERHKLSSLAPDDSYAEPGEL